MRYLYENLNDFSKNKIVLLAGPRQVGKTTLAKHWANEHQAVSLNWDIPEDREQILSKQFMARHSKGYLFLDELHKYLRWKTWLKGLYDRNSPALTVVVTGSARLDIFQKGGDSLLGRYELMRLHPYSIGELSHGSVKPPPTNWLELGKENTLNAEVWNQLECFSGFPEPYHRKDPLQYKRWETRRRELLIREDLRELTQIRQLSLIEHLTLLLPERVGSPLSINGLKEELGVAHDTVSLWLRALERLYYCFRISPYHKKISRSLKKEQKLYLWNWTELRDSASRFENMVASHLLKSIHLWNDIGYGDFDLCYVRNKEKQEVDFLVTKERRPIVLIEVKESELNPQESLFAIGKQLGPEVEKIQIVRDETIDRITGDVRIVSAAKLLAGLS